MSKLIERLDNKLSDINDNGYDDAAHLQEAAEMFFDAYPKLRAVVLAAKGLPHTEWALMEALAALEEDV